MSKMRIGTWNLDTRTSASHIEFLLRADCDVWLLTEVAPQLQLPGFSRHVTSGVMTRGQHWAGIFSRRPLLLADDPHGASALATIDGVSFCASILPWRRCGNQFPWRGATTSEKTEQAVEAILAARPSVWGGDWNHSFRGSERAGSIQGRNIIQRAVGELKLHIATTNCLHHCPGQYAIDHLAVPWITSTAERLPSGALSDHDAYVLESS